MPGIGYGVRLCSLTVGSLSAGVAPITTSRAFNSIGGQVGDTITGSIPGYWVQNETTVTSVIFANDNSVTSIGEYAFSSCTSLTSITIPNGVTSIDYNAFRFCTSLASITIPNSLTSIASYAFYKCQNLASVTFTPTSSVTSIGDYAFGGSGITSFTIPNSVLTINSSAFYDCTSLTSITIPSNVTTIGSKAFKSCITLATVSCYVAQSAFTGSDAFYYTASPLTIRARSTDASWTAGTGLTFQGNTNVTVIKNL